MAAPRQIRICVRKPAGRRLYSRSMPMRPPQSTDKIIRAATEASVTSRNPSKIGIIVSPSLRQISSMVYTLSSSERAASTRVWAWR